MEVSENELSKGEIVWLPLVSPDGSGYFWNSHIGTTQWERHMRILGRGHHTGRLGVDDFYFFLPGASTTLVTCTEHRLFVRCVSLSGQGSCPCDMHVAQLVVPTHVVHVTSLLWTGTLFSVSCQQHSKLTRHSTTSPLAEAVRFPHTTLFSATSP